MWRNYIIKMISLIFFVLISYKGLFDTTFIDDVFGTNFEKHRTSTSICRYDEAGRAMILLAITEFGSLIGEEFLKAIALKLFYDKIRGNQNW